MFTKFQFYYSLLLLLLPSGLMAAPSESESDSARIAAGNIYGAIRREDFAIAKAALAENTNAVNFVFEKKWTLLHWAAEHNSSNGIAILNLLLANGAKVDAKNHIGSTPLFATTTHDNAEGAKILIAHGANVNVRSASGRTPLHCAALNGCPDVARVLIANKAMLNVKDSDRMTPLAWALRERKDFVNSGDAEVVKQYDKTITVLRENRAKE